jgi:ABC-2 type transport system permease protein
MEQLTSLVSTSRSPKWVGYKTIAYREVARVFRIWSQTLLPSVITMGLYFAIFGTFIGSQLPKTQGFPYIQFIVPGLVMMAVITNSYTNVVSTFFGAKMQRYIEELLVSPMPNWVIIAGFVTGGVVRALIVAVLVLIVSLFFTHLVIVNVFVIFGAALLTALLFSFAGLINGIIAKTFDGINIVPIFVLTPLTYLGGVFYSVKLLPWYLRDLSYANPILYMVNAFRYGFLGISDISVAVCFAVMGAFTLVFLGITLYLFNRGVGLRT